MDSATLEPMNVYLPEEVEAAQDPETESLHRAAFIDYTLYQDQTADDRDGETYASWGDGDRFHPTAEDWADFGAYWEARE